MKNFAIILKLINYSNKEEPVKFLKRPLEILGKEKLSIWSKAFCFGKR